jgi:hypothetical protein
MQCVASGLKKSSLRAHKPSSRLTFLLVATAQLLSCSLELNLELNLQLALAAGCHRPYRSGESRRDQLYSGLTSRTSTYDEISEPRIASRVNVWGGVYTEGHDDRKRQNTEYRNTVTPRHLETVRLPIIRHPGRQWALPTQTSADPPPSHETRNFEFDLLLDVYFFQKLRSPRDRVHRLYETRAALRRDCYHPTVRLSRGSPRLL